MNWETLIQLLLIVAAALSGASVLTASLKRERAARLLFASAWLVCLALFLVNYILAKAPPFGNMYQVMSFLPLTLGPLYLYVSRVQKRPWLIGYFSATAMIALIGALSMPVQSNWSRMPALQSPWFVPHVAAYILSYSLATVGTLLAIVSFGQNSEGESRYREAAYGMILLAFPFMTFGLWSGALWADEVWGGYWAWDIKEVWSLITWGGYILYFHLRKAPNWKNHDRTVLLVTYACLIITFLIVNLLPKISSMHSYAM